MDRLLDNDWKSMQQHDLSVVPDIGLWMEYMYDILGCQSRHGSVKLVVLGRSTHHLQVSTAHFAAIATAAATNRQYAYGISHGSRRE